MTRFEASTNNTEYSAQSDKRLQHPHEQNEEPFDVLRANTLDSVLYKEGKKNASRAWKAERKEKGKEYESNGEMGDVDYTDLYKHIQEDFKIQWDDFNDLSHHFQKIPHYLNIFHRLQENSHLLGDVHNDTHGKYQAELHKGITNLQKLRAAVIRLPQQQLQSEIEQLWKRTAEERQIEMQNTQIEEMNKITARLDNIVDDILPKIDSTNQKYAETSEWIKTTIEQKYSNNKSIGNLGIELTKYYNLQHQQTGEVFECYAQAPKNTPDEKRAEDFLALQTRHILEINTLVSELFYPWGQ